MAALALQDNKESTTCVYALGSCVKNYMLSLPSNSGTNIMVAGIVIQLVAMICFCSLGVHFYFRYGLHSVAHTLLVIDTFCPDTRARKDPAHRAKKNVVQGRIGLLTFGLTWASVWILIR